MRADQREATLAGLGDLGFNYICVDEPQGFRSSVPLVVAASGDVGFVRFHGRNREVWEARTRSAAERFDYWYEADELDEWADGSKELARTTGSVHAVMNTNNVNQGPRNAHLLREGLQQEDLAVVDAPGTW